MNISPELQNQLNELMTINKKIQIDSQLIERNQLILSITIDKSLINLQSFEPLDIIRFVLLIKPTYPTTPPLLYCISRFCLPELCDCRDLLEDTLQMKWDSTNCFLKLIISQIPSFIQRYLLYYNNNDNNSTDLFAKRKFFGKYYLDSIYEITIIKYIPYLYFDVISEIVKIEEDENSMNIEDRKILITDNFVLLFCNKSLYELDQLKLVFIGPITSLIYIRQLITDGIVLLNWIIKGKQNNNFFTMKLRTPDGDYIVDTLIDNLSKRSIKFKVTNKLNGNIKREGSVPFVEINLVEEEIKHLEKKINDKEEMSKESISILVNLYEKAVQYYSALNDEKFKIYVEKLHKIYSNNEYTLLLNMKTINKSNKEYNVGMFKRKRKNKNKQIDQSDIGKKKKEKKTKKKDNDNKDTKNNNNNRKEEDKKEENIENNDLNKNEIKEQKNNNINNNNISNNNIINENIINDKEDDKEKTVKKNMRKREEGSKALRKNRNEINNNVKNQGMFIDKKEIEEMIKKELNMNNNNDIIKDDKKNININNNNDINNIKVKNDVNNEDKKDNIIKEENINEKNEIKNNSNEKKEENK